MSRISNQFWVSVALLAVGTVIAYFGFVQFQELRASARWPTTDGEIVISVVRARNTDGQGSGKFFADVAYEYEVEGVGHRSDRISIEDRTPDTLESANQVASRYPISTGVKVYYSPLDPSIAVLEPGSGAGNVVLLGISIVFVVFGVSGIVISISSRGR